MTLPRPTERMDLTSIIEKSGSLPCHASDQVNLSHAKGIADAIIAAGWRSPEQVDALLEQQREGIAETIEGIYWRSSPDAETVRRHAADIARTFTKGGKS